MKNFVQYIDENYLIKVAELALDGDNFVLSGIDVPFLPVGVFIAGVKRSGVNFLNADNLYCLSVVNDLDTIDLNTIPFNHFFEAYRSLTLEVAPLASSGGLGGGTTIDVLPYRHVKLVYAPNLVGEFNKLEDGVIYFDITVWQDATYQQVVIHSSYEPITKKSVQSDIAWTSFSRNGTACTYSGISVNTNNQAGFTPTVANVNTTRIYYNVLTNVFSLSSCAGNVFVPANGVLCTSVFCMNSQWNLYDTAAVNKFAWVVQ